MTEARTEHWKLDLSFRKAIGGKRKAPPPAVEALSSFQREAT